MEIFYISENNIFDILSFDYVEEERFITKQIITYIGNKRKLLNFIGSAVSYIQNRLNKDKLVILDGFSGSGVVSRYLKRYASILYTNDLEDYCYVLNKCYLANISEINKELISENIKFLNSNKLNLSFEKGIIEKYYAPSNDENIKPGERVFYTNKNAKIIDNIRRLIEQFPIEEKYFYLAPLLVKASVHTNTSGVFKGFYKNSNKIGSFGGNAKNCLDRIKKEIKLNNPIFSGNNCEVNVYKEDINSLILKLKDIDIAYCDPPYNQHPYGSNYFMLNLICNYKEPKNISKVSGIPEDWNKSSYNNKNAINSIDNLINYTLSKFILISYNSEGIISLEEMVKICEKYGKVKLLEKGYNTFRGCRNLRNRDKKVKEFLFIIEKK